MSSSKNEVGIPKVAVTETKRKTYEKAVLCSYESLSTTGRKVAFLQLCVNFGSCCFRKHWGNKTRQTSSAFFSRNCRFPVPLGQKKEEQKKRESAFTSIFSLAFVPLNIHELLQRRDIAWVWAFCVFSLPLLWAFKWLLNASRGTEKTWEGPKMASFPGRPY